MQNLQDNEKILRVGNQIVLPEYKFNLIFAGFLNSNDSIDIERVIFNEPATIVFWSDGTKTVVKCNKDDTFDKEKGLAMAICKKFNGNNCYYYDIFKEFCS